MMGHRTALISGDEYDTLTRARKYHANRPGVCKAIKRRHNKRQRRVCEADSRQMTEAHAYD